MNLRRIRRAAAPAASVSVHRSRLSHTLAHIALLSTPLLLAKPVLSAPATAAVTAYAVPAGPLTSALSAFGQQSGALLSFSSVQTDVLRSKGVNGSHTVPAALHLLLEGTGMRASVQTNGGYVIEPASAMPTATLAPVVVTGDAITETATSPVTGFAATRSGTVTRTDTALRELPQSVSVIGREEIDAKGMRDLMDTLVYTPGVSARLWGHDDRAYEAVSMRGFETGMSHNYLDGLAQWSFVEVTPLTEIYGMERIEVLRGPTSATFGRGDVAGVINRVTKRPDLRSPSSEVQAQGGNFAHRQAAADLNRPIGDTVAMRLVALTRRADDQAHYPGGITVQTRRHYLAPSLLWQPSAGTSLLMQGSVVRQDAGDDYGYVDDVDPDLETREGDPDFSRIRQNAWTAGYLLRHAFAPNWSLNQRMRHADRDATKNHIRPAVLQADGRTIRRTAIAAQAALKQTSVDTFIEGRLQTAGVAHNLVAGVDWTRLRALETEKTGEAPDLDLYQPVYRPIRMPVQPGEIYGPYRLDATGVYLQDQATVASSWVATLSARHDWTRANASLNAGPTTRRRDSGLSTRAALTWLAPRGFAPYVSYSTSFNPTIGVFDDFATAPTRGRQWEAGIKYQPDDAGLLLTAAVFDLEKRNIVVTNPRTDVTEQVGKIRSRGLELEAKGEILPDVSITAAYTYLSVQGLQGNTWYVQEGRTPRLVPRHTASLWVDYRVPASIFSGLNLGAGVRHVGKTWNDAANTVRNAGYTLVDASVRYDLDTHWRFALNANNLLGKRYYTDGYLARGEARTIVASTTYRW